MGVRIIRHQVAANDVEELADYIACDNFDAAARFVDAVEQTIIQIGGRPEIGSPCECWSSKLRGIRRWPVTGFTRYLVFYRFTENRIAIIRVLHSSRNIEVLLMSDMVS